MSLRSACVVLFLLVPQISFATPAVTLVHCLFHHYGQGRWELIFAYGAIGRDFGADEWIRMSGSRKGYLYTGACMKVSGTDGDRLAVLTKEVQATKLDGYDNECDGIGSGVVMLNPKSSQLARGKFVEVSSHDYKSGDVQMLLHTYFLRYDQLGEDLTVFPGRYCRSVMPGAIEADLPAEVNYGVIERRAD